MKTFNSLLREVIKQGVVPPTSRRFTTKQEKDQIEKIVVEQLARLYQSATQAGVPENFKLDAGDKKQLLNALITAVDEEVIGNNQSMIGTMIKDFEFAVNNGGKIKALIEDSGAIET